MTVTATTSTPADETSPPTTAHPPTCDAWATPSMTPSVSSPASGRFGHAERHQRPDGAGAHGRQVAQRPHEGLPPHIVGAAEGQIDVDALHHAVHRDHHGSAAGDIEHGGVVAQSTPLDSISERVTDTLQGLVFNETGHAPGFGGTHGTCLALDAASTGRTKE